MAQSCPGSCRRWLVLTALETFSPKSAVNPGSRRSTKVASEGRAQNRRGVRRLGEGTMTLCCFVRALACLTTFTPAIFTRPSLYWLVSRPNACSFYTPPTSAASKIYRCIHRFIICCVLIVDLSNEPALQYQFSCAVRKNNDPKTTSYILR